MAMPEPIPQQKPKDMLRAALAYYQLGWSVIPLHSVHNGACTCLNGPNCQDKGKHPRVAWTEYQTQRADELQIRRWWKKWPDANIGIVTGAVSGIVVLDVDVPKGEDTLREGRYHLPPTPTSRTGSGGLHYVYKHPGGDCRNFAGKIGKTILPNVDFRGDGGLFVAPPSLHASGRRYEWLLSPLDVEIAEAPEWLVKLIREQAATHAIREASRLAPEDWETDIPEGQRNTELTRRAGALLAGGRMSPSEALTMLLAWNERHCKPPLPESEVRQIVESIAARETAKQQAKQASKEETLDELIAGLPRELDFQEHQSHLRKLFTELAKAGPLERERVAQMLKDRYKLSLNVIREEIRAAEARLKLEPAKPVPLDEPRAAGWSLAQDMRGDVFHYGIWLPTEAGDFQLRLVTSDGRIEEPPPVPTDRLPRDMARWSVDIKTPYNVFAYLNGQVSINPTELHNELTHFFRRFMWYPDDRTYSVLAAWVMLTYVFMVFDQVPYLKMVGTKRAGKTRTLELLEMLAFNAKLSSSLSDAYVFRAVEMDRVTLLVDEAENLARQPKEAVNERLELFRSGYRRSGSVGRVEGEAHQRVDYSTYSPKAFANATGIEDALEDRTIDIPVERKPKNVRVEKLSHRRIRGEAQVLRNKLYCFGLQWARKIAEIYEQLEVDVVDDREAEIWAGMMSIAKLVGNGLDSVFAELAKENAERKELREGVESEDAQVILAVWMLAGPGGEPPLSTPEARGVPGRWYSSKRVRAAVLDQLEWETVSYKWLANTLVKLGIIKDSKEYKHRFRIEEEINGKIRRQQIMCYNLQPDLIRKAAERFGIDLEHRAHQPRPTVPTRAEAVEEDDDESPY